MLKTSLVLLHILFCSVGCRQEASDAGYTPQTVCPGTKSYEHRVASFKVGPTLAGDAAGAASPNSTMVVSLVAPTCVIDEWYLFSKPYKYQRIDLKGIYVNGLTGKIECREHELSLLPRKSVFAWLRKFPANMPTSLAGAQRYH